MFSVHTTSEEFQNEGFFLKTLKCSPFTLRRRNSKTEVSLWKRSNVFRPHYAGEIQTRRFYSENALTVFVHTTWEEFKNEGFILKRLNVFRRHYAGGIQKRRFHSENAQMVSVQSTSEEFKNGSFILKTFKCFLSTLRRRNSKKEVSLWKRWNVFRSHYAGGLKPSIHCVQL